MTAVDDRVQTLSIDTIRCLAMDAVQKANAGHPGTAMALAPVAYVLYARAHAPRPRRTRLARPRPLRALGRARVHPPVRRAAPVGLRPHDGRPEAVPAVGVAHARASRARRGTPPASRSRPARSARASATRSAWRSPRQMLAARYNRDGPRRSSTTAPSRSAPTATSWRACRARPRSIAGFLGLGKLCLIYDDNHITIEGSTDLAFGEDVGRPLRGLRLPRPAPRRRLDDRRRCATRSTAADAETERPSLIIAAHAHRDRRPARAGHRRRRTARRSARRRSASPSRPTAGIPTSTSTCRTRSTTHCDQRARGADRRTRWDERLDAYRAAHPELAAEFERVLSGELPGRLGGRAARPLGRRPAGDARELERLHQRRSRRRSPSSSAARPTSRRRRTR